MTVMGKSTFTVDMAVRQSYPFRLPDVTCRLAIRKIIPMSSDIVKACESKDLATVKDLLLRHRYGPNDMTEDFRPLLWVITSLLSLSVLIPRLIRGTPN